jgi:glutathione S-transferase
MVEPIIFYDLPNSLQLEKRPSSGHCLRTRYFLLSCGKPTWIIIFSLFRIMLNYKQIPYKTVWIDYADIQDGLKELGAPSTGTKPDGSTPWYSLPTIYDPKTSSFTADSVEIAKYLESEYPTPGRQVIPPGAEQEQIQFVQTVGQYLGVCQVSTSS